MRLQLFGSITEFLAVAGDFLVAREAESNLLLGIAGTLRDHPQVYPEPPYLAVVSDQSGVVLVAIRTPPFDLVLSDTNTPDALHSVVEDVARRFPDLGGFSGPVAVSRQFADRWLARTGQPARVSMAERIYRLVTVVQPAPQPAGRWRLAGEADTTLIARWLVDFQREALPGDGPMPDPLAMAERYVHGLGRAMYLWEVDHLPVSMVGVGGRTPNGVRIGPVYTPPTDRRRGYAAALTAAASQDSLDAGCRFCFLFTDLANPTSNNIYQAIGYEPVTDVDRYRIGTHHP
ncbi:MAG TPA: GNAT family N-acetyltransferase [Candidatus Limnocylindrales bacterium]